MVTPWSADPNPALAGLFISVAVYLLAIIWFFMGTFRRVSLTTQTPLVSVVLAARDEAGTIEATLNSLLEQSYEPSLLEVILVDDGSTDDTLLRATTVASRHKAEAPSLHIVDGLTSMGSSGSKKAALTLAISRAAGEIILSTDADCQVPRDWVSKMVAHFDEGVDAVVGFSQITEPGLRAGIEALDFLLLMTAARGACGNGHPVAASGQSIGFRRDAFDEVDGYETVKHRSSGDDVLLLQLLRGAGKRIVFAHDEAASVVHPAVPSMRGLIAQRIRWASNGPIQLRLDPRLFLHLTATLLLNVGIVVAFGLAVVGRVDPMHVAGIWGSKAIGDVVLALRGAWIFRRWDLLLFWPIWEVLHPVYIVIAGGLGCLGVFRWKGTRVRLGRPVTPGVDGEGGSEIDVEARGKS